MRESSVNQWDSEDWIGRTHLAEELSDALVEVGIVEVELLHDAVGFCREPHGERYGCGS